MKKLKTILILLLTAALLWAGACLPEIVAKVQDRAFRNKTGLSEIPSIQLNIREVASTPERLWLLRSGNIENASTPATDTAMTSQEVVAAATEALLEYARAGLIPELDISAAAPYAKLIYCTDAPERNGIFWTLELSDIHVKYDSLVMIIDDATGAIMSFYYFANEDLFSEAYKEYLVYTFFDLYLKQLGAYTLLQEPEAYGLESVVQEYPEQYSPEEAYLHLTLTHEGYSSLTLTFVIYNGGIFMDIY